MTYEGKSEWETLTGESESSDSRDTRDPQRLSRLNKSVRRGLSARCPFFTERKTMLSLLSIDCGFDPRVHGMLCHLNSDWREGVKFHPNPNSCLEEEEVIPGGAGIETVAETLSKAGYAIIAAHTSNGREIRCLPPGHEPIHNGPGFEWVGPIWCVQARNDNYWIGGPTLASVIDRAGWSPNEIEVP